MKRKRSLLLSSLMLFAFAMVLTASKPVQAKKVTTYVETSSKEYHEYDSKFQLMWKTTSKYDKNGNRIAYSTTDYYSSRKGKTTKFKYVYKKNLLQKSTCNGKLDSKYTYDKKGNILTYKSYEKGKLSWTTTNTYKKGKIVSSISKRGNKVIDESTYYSKGSIKSSIGYGDNGEKTVYEYKRSGAYKYRRYDSEGRIVEEGSYDNKGNGSGVGYRYNESGEKVKVYEYKDKSVYKKGVTTKTEYTHIDYDDNGEAHTYKNIREYYTSGYRSGWVKTERNTYSDGTVTGTDYSYKADSTGKNVAVQTGKDMKSKKVESKCKYTYKKITTTVK